MLPKYGHCGFGQAKPSVSMRLGAPRRLFTSLQGRDFRGHCPSTRQRSGAETTGGAIVWGARLEKTVEPGARSSCFEVGRLEREPAMTPKPGQSKDEEEHEQEHVDLKGHKDPRCQKWGA